MQAVPASVAKHLQARPGYSSDVKTRKQYEVLQKEHHSGRVHLAEYVIHINISLSSVLTSELFNSDWKNGPTDSDVASSSLNDVADR